MLRWLKTNHHALTAIGAMVVGLAALFVAWDQARVMRAQQHGSVMPAIQLDSFVQDNEGVLRVGLRMRNNGVGPALIHDFGVSVNGNSLNSWDNFSAIAPQTENRNWTSLLGRVLGPEEEIVAISLAWTEIDETNESEIGAFLYDLSRSATAEVCYCSVFDRCYVSRSTPTGHELPRQVDACPGTTDWNDQIHVTPQSSQEDDQ
jgi:hypothetical protein